jgi:hypothetical protein
MVEYDRYDELVCGDTVERRYYKDGVLVMTERTVVSYRPHPEISIVDPPCSVERSPVDPEWPEIIEG